MPNWCRTDIIFHGNDTELSALYQHIKQCLSSGADLFDLLCNSAFVNRDVRYHTLELTDYIVTETDNAKFGLILETAWLPRCAIWVDIIKQAGYKTVGFSYCGVEESNGVYHIYDEYGDFNLKYAVDMWLEGDDEGNDLLVEFMDISDYSSDEELRIALQRLLQTKESDLDLLIGQAMTYAFADENSYINIHTYKFLDEPQ